MTRLEAEHSEKEKPSFCDLVSLGFNLVLLSLFKIALVMVVD